MWVGLWITILCGGKNTAGERRRMEANVTVEPEGQAGKWGNDAGVGADASAGSEVGMSNLGPWSTVRAITGECKLGCSLSAVR